MNNTNWLVFSFSLSAKAQSARVKIWRKLNALGAAQLKNAIYLLPLNEHLEEQLTWLAKQAEDEGGEAVLIKGGELLNAEPEQIQQAFAQARASDYAAITAELRELLQAGGQAENHASALRKLERRFQNICAIDYFPGETQRELARLFEQAAGPEETGGKGSGRLNPADYRGKTWITRANLYIDRLASFWLVRRFIDENAAIRFIMPGEFCEKSQEVIRFDMAKAEFTHERGLITFEVIREAFGLETLVPAAFSRVIRAIDLEEGEAGPAEAAGVKLLLDGLVKSCPEDLDRLDQALALFDNMLNSYKN